MKTNLESIGAKVIADSFPVTAILNHKSYKIDANGNVEMQEVADRTGINVGDYINFEPDTDQDAEGNPVAKTYSKEYLSKKYTGNIDNKYNNSDLVQAPLKWQVLKIYEDGSMKLIGKPTSFSIRFAYLNAYNNGVWILNDICEHLYSKKSEGIVARSINIEDFEDDDYYANETKGNWRKARYDYIKSQILVIKEELINGSDYIDDVDLLNNTVTYKKDYSYYPMIYQYENGSGIDTKNVKTNGISRCNKYFINRDMIDRLQENGEKKQANILTTKYTGYEIALNEDNYGYAYSSLEGGYYWLASREVVCNNNRVKFGMYRVIDSSRMFCGFFSSDSSGGAKTGGTLRPIVTLGPNVKITPNETASSEDGTPHEITAYK